MKKTSLLRAVAASSLIITAAELCEGQGNRGAILSGLIVSNVLGTICFRASPTKTLEMVKSSLLASSFVQVDIPHLLSNIGILAATWSPATTTFGVERTLGLYLSGALLTSAASTRTVTNLTYITVGSSGAISAVLAAVLWKKDAGPILAPTGSFALIMVSAFMLWSKRLPSLDHMNHLVGFCYGSSFAFLHDQLILKRRLYESRDHPVRERP